MNLSVIINTRNEEKNIEGAIGSIHKIADEIIIVDMESTDDTVKLAKRLGAKIYKFKNMNYVEPARNFAISKAKGDWIFILDADERIGNSLALKIKKATESSKADYYALPRKNIIFGKWMKHSRWWPDYNVRLFRKGAVEWSDEIHSVPFTTGRGLDFEAKSRSAILHYNYSTLEQFVERMNRYTTLQAKMRVQAGDEFDWRDLLRKPGGEFLSRYFGGRGYKDGLHGLAMASLQACSELLLYLKVWQLNKFVERDLALKEVVGEMRSVNKEYNYWMADSLVRAGAGSLERVRRKFKLQ